jgi:hypothetical protein
MHLPRNLHELAKKERASSPAINDRHAESPPLDH